MARPSTQIAGTVEALTPSGVKLAGRWWNYSKFTPVNTPALGQSIVLTIENDKFIAAIDPQETAAPAPFEPTPAPVAQEIYVDVHTPQPEPSVPDVLTPDQRLQVRIGAAIAAASYCPMSGAVGISGMLTFAAEIENWITRG